MGRGAPSSLSAPSTSTDAGKRRFTASPMSLEASSIPLTNKVAGIASNDVRFTPPAIVMRTLAEFYDVSLETVKDWERRGAPVQDPAAMADWVMDQEPKIREGFERAQAVADRLPSMAKRASAAGDTAFAAEMLEALTGWLSSPHCHALTRRRSFPMTRQAHPFPLSSSSFEL
jgi:hypothetical protein